MIPTRYTPPPSLRWRQSLALVRLLLLYFLACTLAASVGLLWRTTLESGVGLNRTLPRTDGKGAQPPFAGVNVEIDAYPAESAADRLATLRAAGFGWVRQSIEWRTIEAEPGRFDWHEADRIIGLVTDAGLEPVVVLCGAPDWALMEGERGDSRGAEPPPADLADFARFAEAFARRYGDRVRYYQVWEEPNIAPNWGRRHINPVEYAQMLREVAPAIRSADADAVILAAALAPTTDRGHLAIDEVYFLQRMIAGGAAPYFDVVAIQPFGFGRSPHDARQRLDTLNFARAGLIRRELVAAGLGAKPLWAVRYGWNRTLNSPWGTVTPAAQATFARAALDRAWHEWPWLVAMGWVIDQPNEAPGMPSWGFALRTHTNLPAPVLAALAKWQNAMPSVRRAAPALPALFWFLWGGVVFAAAFIGWRIVAAARAIEWRKWQERYQRAPVWFHVGAWSTLIVVYYLATFPPLIVFCWIAAVWFCLAQPQVGLWLALALIPFFYQHKEVYLVDAVLTVPPTHLLAFALLPALIAHMRQKHNAAHPVSQTFAPRSSASAPVDPPVDPHVVWWELIPLLLILMTLVSTVNVWHWPAFIRGALDLVVVPLLLWWGVRALTSGKAERQRALLALFVGGLLVALVGLMGWLHMQSAEVDGIRRLVGPHFSPNHTALYLERTLFVGIGAIVLVVRRWRTAMALAVSVVAATLVLTGSRGALLLGAPAGLLVMAGFSLYRRPALARWIRIRRDLMLQFWLVTGLLVLFILFWQRERLTNLETLALRLDLWLAALALWRDHFWAGVGPGGFFWNYPAYLRVGAVEVDQLHPHSVWLELTTTWGVLGIAWFVLCIVGLTMAVRRLRCSGNVEWLIAVSACAGLAAGLAHAQTDTFLLLADLAAWNAVAWALVTAPTVAVPSASRPLAA